MVFKKDTTLEIERSKDNISLKIEKQGENTDRILSIIQQCEGLKRHEWVQIKDNVDRLFSSIANKITLDIDENDLEHMQKWL